MLINRLVDHLVSQEKFDDRAKGDVENILRPAGKKMAMRFTRGNVAIQEGAYLTREEIDLLPRLKR